MHNACPVLGQCPSPAMHSIAQAEEEQEEGKKRKGEGGGG